MTQERRLLFGATKESSSVINCDDISQSQIIDPVATITQDESITLDDVAQLQVTGDLFISASNDDHQIIISDLTQAQVTDGITISELNIFNIDELSQGQTLEGVVSGTEFDIDDLTQAQTLDTVVLEKEFDIDDLLQAQLLDATQHVEGDKIFNPDDLLQAQTIESTENAISIRRFTSEISNVEGQSLVVDVPIGTIDGDYMVAILATDGAAETHSADGAWTAIESSLSSGGHTLSVYERMVSGAEPATYTFTWTSNEKSVGVILLIKGGDDAAPLDKDDNITGLSNEPVAPGLTPLKPDSLFLSINTHDQSGGLFYGITYPTGFTNEVNVGAGPQSGVAIQVGSKNLSTVSAEPQQDWTMSVSDNWYTLSLIIKTGPAAFVVDSITQAQLLDELELNTRPDDLSQIQSVGETIISASNDDHQIIVSDLTQAQSLDTYTIVETLGSLLIVEDNFARGVAGGTATAGVNTRVLNNIVVNSITGASLATNQITLPAGTYEIEATSGQIIDVDEAKMYLYNVTDASDAVLGDSAFSHGGAIVAGGGTSLQGRFTIAAEKDFEIRTYVGRTGPTDGFGNPNDDGINVEIYLQVVIWQV